VQSHLSIDLKAAREQLRLDERLAKIPSTAGVRGVWFNMMPQHLKRIGRGAEAAYRAAGCGKPRTLYKLYAVGEFLEELLIGGAITRPDDAAAGMREIWRHNIDAFYQSLIGRSVKRLVRPSPATALRWVERSRHLSCNYGSWWVEAVTPEYSVMHLNNEYIWIDSAHLGGAEAMLDACGVNGSVNAELLSDFDGRLHIRWQP
jgi:uncharacterized protein (TIGR02265 family)